MYNAGAGPHWLTCLRPGCIEPPLINSYYAEILLYNPGKWTEENQFTYMLINHVIVNDIIDFFSIKTG